MPKTRKVTPPPMVVFFSEILVASIRPPSTASPVQSECPMQPPTMVPVSDLWLARAICVREKGAKKRERTRERLSRRGERKVNRGEQG